MVLYMSEMILKSRQFVKVVAKGLIVGALAVTLGLPLSGPLSGSAPHAYAQSVGPASVADVAAGLLDAVVNISTSQKVKQRRPNAPVPRVPDGSPFQEFFDDLFPKTPDGEEGDGSRSVQSLGSGFVISADGLVVTNNHVIADADEIIANFADGTKLVAELVGTDAKTDIAVLRVKSDTKLPFVVFGDSDKSRIGDWVMAIGNPFGLGGTVTLGIVSATGRDINSGPYDNFIQTDAAINRGNSGGPLFNMSGEVVGINTAIISPSGGSIGIGFSVPSSLAKPVIDQLVEFGETRRGWLGVQIQSVTDEIAETLGLDRARGALVGDVFKDGPAEAGGIQSGDVVLSFDGGAITVMRDLPRIVADTPVNKVVDVVILRKGKEQTLKVKVGLLQDGEKSVEVSKPANEPQEPVKPEPILGMMLEELTDEARDSAGIAGDVKGVLVADVESGSSAEDKGLKSGDVIVEINQEQVNSPAGVVERLGELKKEGRKNALLMVQPKEGAIGFFVLRIDD